MTEKNNSEILKNTKPKRTCMETYQGEIAEYLVSKLAPFDVPTHTIKEIAQYCMTETVLVANDEVRRFERQSRRMKKHN